MDRFTEGWLAWASGGVIFVVLLLLLIWLSNASLRAAHRDGGANAGGADAFGGLIEAFEPGRARADKDLESAKHQGQVLPSPGIDDDPMKVDLRSGKVQIRVPKPAAAAEPPGETAGGSPEQVDGEDPTTPDA